ncbi:MAG TPA: GNAT family N-acetyltransferase [Gemmatimonadaceae bacterium]|nr:GNAT family N-acetyltransferase [Gemmatimonadaceae bacterium]
MTPIRRCRTDEHGPILAVINAAAERYRGTIPADCWHEPYMSSEQLARDVAAGVSFWVYEDDDGELAGVMGLQPVNDVTLVRHAYVLPSRQGKGIGRMLLRHLEELSDQAILIGTWADATWAIGFYQAHGYSLIPPQDTPALLNAYWSIPPRQVATSVVLMKPARTVTLPIGR